MANYDNKVLDGSGLARVWVKVKALFATKAEHDDTKSKALKTFAFGGAGGIAGTTVSGETVTISSNALAAANKPGLVKAGGDTALSSGCIPCPIVNGVPYYKDTDTTYQTVSGTQNGLMTSTLYNKLNGIQAGAQVNPGNATTTNAGLMSASDKQKLNGIQAGAQVNPGNATTTNAGLMSTTDKSRLDTLYTQYSNYNIVPRYPTGVSILSTPILVCAGYITSSSGNVVFTVPLNRSLSGRTVVYISGFVTMRHVGGGYVYLVTSTDSAAMDDFDFQSNATSLLDCNVSVAKNGDLGLKVEFTCKTGAKYRTGNSSSSPVVTNNTPVAVSIHDLQISLT